MAVSEETKWQPIKTAPKDRRIELWIPRSVYRAGYPTHGKWDDDKYGRKPRPFWLYDAAVNITHSRESQPTHWRPESIGPVT